MYKGFSIYDFCAFMIILSLILSIFLRKLWRYKKSRVFLLSLSISAFTIIVDSVYLKIVNLPLNNSLLTFAYILQYLFLFLLIVVVLFSYIYLLSTMGLFSFFKKKKNFYFINICCLLVVPVVFLIVSIPFKFVFTISSEGVYISNLGHYFYYIWLMLIYGFGILTAIRNNRFLNKIKIIDCFILYPTNLICVFHQMLHPNYPFIMFALAMTFYIILITTQRPEDLINPTINARSSSAYYVDTETAFKTEQNIFHIYVKILNHSQIKKYIGERSYIDYLANVSAEIHRIINEDKTFADLYYIEDSEFCVVVDGSKHNYIEKIAQKINVFFNAEYKFMSFSVYPDVKTCVVNLPYDVENLGYLFYFAKAFHHIIPSEESLVKFEDIAQTQDFKIKNDIEQIIKKAIKADRFDVFYQPILNVEHNKIESAEALVRLTDEQYGVIAPSYFIPFAEMNGIMLQIGDIVFKKVFEFISSDAFKKSGLKYIQVNLTLAQCLETNFAEKVIALLDEYKVQPSQIQFEITEAIEEFSVEVIDKNIVKLREKGIVFALDDYGIGYSNIKQVISLPVSIVKLDKSFVQEIDNEQMRIIIQGTISMLKNLGKQILVEGIESKESMDYFLSLQSCDYVQGYFIAKPLSINELLNFSFSTKI